MTSFEHLLKPSFLHDLIKLPPAIQKKVTKAVDFLRQDPRHLSFQVKKLEGALDVWEARSNLASPARQDLERFSIRAALAGWKELIQKVQAGAVRIPQFQRPLRWSVEEVRRLLDSIWRGYPVGSILSGWPAAQAVHGAEQGPVRTPCPRRDGSWDSEDPGRESAGPRATGKSFPVRKQLSGTAAVIDLLRGGRLHAPRDLPRSRT